MIPCEKKKKKMSNKIFSFEVIHIYYIFIYYIYCIYNHYYLLYFYYIYIYIITYIYRRCFVNLVLFDIFVTLEIQTIMWEESCHQWNYHDFSTRGFLKVNISLTFIWNAFFISCDNAMIEICHCYWKIVDEHENSRKVTLKGEKHESQYSPF